MAEKLNSGVRNMLLMNLVYNDSSNIGAMAAANTYLKVFTSFSVSVLRFVCSLSCCSYLS